MEALYQYRQPNAFMEAPQQRRRRPAATYGKSVKKRYSDFGVVDSFSSATSSPKPREEQRTTSTGVSKTISSSTILVTATATTVKAQEKDHQQIKPPPLTNGGEAYLLARPTEKGTQTTLKGSNKRPSPAFAVASPSKHLKVFDFDSSEDGIGQPRKTAFNPKGNDEFEVPSSDEESTIIKKKTLPQSSSRTLSAPTNVKGFAKVKSGVASLSARDNNLFRNDRLPKEQRKQITKSATTASRVVKFPSFSKALKPSKSPKSLNTAPPESPTGPNISLVNVKIDELALQRSRITRSQPGVEPEASKERQPDQKASRATLTQMGPQMGSSNGLAKPPKSAVTKRARRVLSVSLPVIYDESPRPPSPPSLQALPQATRRDSIICSSGILSHVDEPPKKDKQQSAESRRPKRIRESVPRISEIFQNGVEESAPRRRRLIDRLGAGLSQSDLMESLSSSSYESEEEYSEPQSLSQSRDMLDSQIVDTVTEGQSQESATEPLVKLVYSNGRVGPKVTYAQQRSFRTEELDEDALFNTPLIMAQQRNTGLEESEELEGDTGSKMMKTIHELREAGTNNRFLDDIEELFGDIEGGTSLGRQRSGHLELALKMRDKTFIGKFRANNFTERLLTSLDKQTDEIICFGLSFILCCLLLEDTTLQTVSQVRNNGSLSMLVRMLDFEKDIYLATKDRKTNMSKAAQGVVRDLRTRVEKSPVFGEKKPKVFSGQIMALKVLEESVRKLREAGVSEDFLPAGGLKKLVQIMNLFSESKDTVKAPPGTLPLELTVSILESYTIGSRVSPELQFSVGELKVVANLLPTVVEIGAKDMKDILLLILRFDINLTNGHSSICDIFAEFSPFLIPTLVYMVRDKFNDLAGLELEMEERLSQLDLLVLSLGLLINFAELSDKARHAVVGKDTILLDVLLRIFLERLERTAEVDSVEESHTNVAFGYLSILLGNLCQNFRIGDKIRQKMPKTTLTPLISSLEEFIAHHRRVDDQYEGYGEGPNAMFTERLEQVVKKLRS